MAAIPAVCPAAAAIVGLTQRIASQETAYPNEPSLLIVPYPAGSAPDMLVRQLSRRMIAAFGQTLVR